MSEEWTWRVADAAKSRGLRLRYEPGNWGDVLKAGWLLTLLRAQLEREAPLCLADPFAGAPDYPLTEAAAERFRLLQAPWLQELQRPFFEAGLWASSARLALQLGGDRLRVRVFDADATRCAAWQNVAGATRFEVEDGYAALTSAHLEGCALVLVDPYDLDKRWSAFCRLLPALRSAGCSLLLYLYNRSPRGAGHFEEYRSFRKHLAAAWSAEPLVGRVPADSRLARAWHEMIWLSPEEAPQPGLRTALRELTEQLAWQILRPGVVEG